MKQHNKYFIAIIPPPTVFEKIEEIKQELYSAHKLKGALRSPSHITLHRPFEWKAEKEDLLVSTLNDFPFKKNFRIELKGFDCFQPRVIFVNVLKNEELNNLHYQLTGYAKRQLGLFNESDDLRGFHPHVTVAFRDLKKQLFYKLWEQYQQKGFQESFNYLGFSLLRMENKWERIQDFVI